LLSLIILTHRVIKGSWGLRKSWRFIWFRWYNSPGCNRWFIFLFLLSYWVWLLKGVFRWWFKWLHRIRRRLIGLQFSFFLLLRSTYICGWLYRSLVKSTLSLRRLKLFLLWRLRKILHWRVKGRIRSWILTLYRIFGVPWHLVNLSILWLEVTLLLLE